MTAGDVTAANDGERPVSWSVEGPEHGSREARAALALKLVAAAYIVGILLAEVRGSVPVANLWTVAFNLAAGVIAAVYVVVARGLDRRRSVGVGGLSADPCRAGDRGCVCRRVRGAERHDPDPVRGRARRLGVARTARRVRRRSRGRRHATRPGRTRMIGRRGLALLVVAVAMAGQMAFGNVVYGWGGALDVHPADLARHVGRLVWPVRRRTAAVGGDLVFLELGAERAAAERGRHRPRRLVRESTPPAGRSTRSMPSRTPGAASGRATAS